MKLSGHLLRIALLSSSSVVLVYSQTIKPALRTTGMRPTRVVKVVSRDVEAEAVCESCLSLPL